MSIFGEDLFHEPRESSLVGHGIRAVAFALQLKLPLFESLPNVLGSDFLDVVLLQDSIKLVFELSELLLGPLPSVTSGDFFLPCRGNCVAKLGLLAF